MEGRVAGLISHPGHDALAIVAKLPVENGWSLPTIALAFSVATRRVCQLTPWLRKACRNRISCKSRKLRAVASPIGSSCGFSTGGIEVALPAENILVPEGPPANASDGDSGKPGGFRERIDAHADELMTALPTPSRFLRRGRLPPKTLPSRPRIVADPLYTWAAESAASYETRQEECCVEIAHPTSATPSKGTATQPT